MNLRQQAEEAVVEVYNEEGQRLWWAHHDAQDEVEQERLQRIVIAGRDGNA